MNGQLAWYRVTWVVGRHCYSRLLKTTDEQRAITLCDLGGNAEEIGCHRTELPL